MGLFDVFSGTQELDTRIASSLSKYFSIRNPAYKSGMKMLQKNQAKILSTLNGVERVVLIYANDNYERGGINILTSKRVMNICRPIKLAERPLEAAEISLIQPFSNDVTRQFGFNCLNEAAVKDSEHKKSVYWDNVVVISATTPAIALEAINAMTSVIDGLEMEVNVIGSLRLGYADLAKRYSHELIDTFDEAIRLDGKNSDAYFNRARVLSIVGKYEDAMADYDTTIKLDSTNAYAYFGRGGLWGIFDKLDRRIEDYKKAVSLQPNNMDFKESLELALKEVSGESDGS